MAAKSIPSDLDIAQSAVLEPISRIAMDLGLRDGDIELYGRYMAKVELSVTSRLQSRPNAKYVLVTAVTPTPLGEGKTVTTIGLTQGLNRIGRKAIT